MALSRGGWHTVIQGETLIGLARVYRVSHWRIISTQGKSAPPGRDRPTPQTPGRGAGVYTPDPAPVEYGGGVAQNPTFGLKKPRESFVPSPLRDRAGGAPANRRYEL